MNLVLKIIILRFLLLAVECQIGDQPNCNFQREQQEGRYNENGEYYHVYIRSLNCYSGSFIFDEFFNQWQSDSNYETDKIFFHDSYFHTIPALTFYKLPDLREIYLNASGITTLEVACFAGLKHLETLQLNDNNIEVLDKGVLNSLTNLITLNLSNNQLYTIHKDSFKDLVRLEGLFLDGNKLHFLPDDLFANLKKIQLINLSENYLETLNSSTLQQLVDLKFLYLNDNKLNYIHKDSFKDLVRLEGLFLDGNKLHFLPDDLFANLKKIQLINLSKNYLETLDSSTFYQLEDMEYLYIDGNKLKCIPPNLFKDLSKLILLDISNNSLTNVSGGMLSGLNGLIHLNISHNQISTFKARNLYFLNNLKELNVAYNNINYLNTDELLLLLPNLKEIYLYENNWTCGMLSSVIRAFRKSDVQVNPGKQYNGENLLGIACTDSSTNTSNDHSVLPIGESEESRGLQNNHILTEIAGKISENNNLMEKLIHASLNSTQSIQTIAENVQKNAINEKSSFISHIPNQNTSISGERTNSLLENMLNELRIEHSNTMSILQTITNHWRVNDDYPRLNDINPQSPLPYENNSHSPSISEFFKFMNNMKAELDISMKNMSQSIASIQAKINEPATPKNNNNQLIPERLQGNATQSNAGNGNIAIIVCLFVLVVILIIILGITYIQYKKGSFIANGLRRYKSNRPPGNRSDTDLITTSTTMSNSEV